MWKNDTSISREPTHITQTITAMFGTLGDLTDITKLASFHIDR